MVCALFLSIQNIAKFLHQIDVSIHIHISNIGEFLLELHFSKFPNSNFRVVHIYWEATWCGRNSPALGINVRRSWLLFCPCLAVALVQTRSHLWAPLSSFRNWGHRLNVSLVPCSFNLLQSVLQIMVDLRVNGAFTHSHWLVSSSDPHHALRYPRHWVPIETWPCPRPQAPLEWRRQTSKWRWSGHGIPGWSEGLHVGSYALC